MWQAAALSQPNRLRGDTTAALTFRKSEKQN